MDRDVPVVGDRDRAELLVARAGAGRCRGERKVIRIDIRDLNCDEALRVCRRRAQVLAKQLRESLDELRVQPPETLQFLVHNCQQLATKGTGRRGGNTMLVQLCQILTSSDAAQTGRLEEPDLRLDEEIERDLGHEQARTRASRVADGGADVLVVEIVRRLNARERVPKDIVEDIVDPRPAGELLGRDVDICALNGGDKVADESGHKAEDEPALLLDTNCQSHMKKRGERQNLVSVAVDSLVAERVEFLLGLAHKRVQARLHIRQFVAYMIHEHLQSQSPVIKPPTTKHAQTNLMVRLWEKLRPNRPVPVRDIAVLRMTLEEVGLAIKRVRHALVDIDVLLRADHEANKAKLERVHAPREYVERVRARIHRVELGQDDDRPPVLGIDGPRELQGLGVGKVDVGGRDSEGDAVPKRVREHMKRVGKLPSAPIGF